MAAEALLPPSSGALALQRRDAEAATAPDSCGVGRKRKERKEAAVREGHGRLVPRVAAAIVSVPMAMGGKGKERY